MELRARPDLVASEAGAGDALHADCGVVLLADRVHPSRSSSAAGV